MAADWVLLSIGLLAMYCLRVARIRSLSEGKQNIHPHASEVDCYYSVIDDSKEMILHLSTFGSDGRKTEPKSSQSIQIDEQIARQLISLLQRTFPCT